MGDRLDVAARAPRREAGRRPLRRSSGRQAVDFCEVELVFDNEDGGFGELPFSEISVARRLHRGGEGQYLVNATAVRRIDLVELLSDVGLGGGLRSVISQGRVELGARRRSRQSGASSSRRRPDSAASSAAGTARS